MRSFFLITNIVLSVVISSVAGSFDAVCSVNNDCDTLDAFCTSSRNCQCSDGFLPLDGACVQIISTEGCTNSLQCAKTTRATCYMEKCVCPRYHHHVGNECLSNRGLYEYCRNNNDCYWGQDMLDKMSCRGGKCSCNDGYIKRERQCVSGAESLIISFVALILATTVSINFQ